MRFAHKHLLQRAGIGPLNVKGTAPVGLILCNRPQFA